MSPSISKRTWLQYRVLTGIILANLPAGFSVYYGNLYVYITSYYKFCLPTDRKDIAPEWIFSSCLVFVSFGNLIGDFLKFRFGLRVSVFIGQILYGCGILLCYLTVQQSIWATAIAFSCIGIFGLGIAEVLSFCYTSYWFPHNQGLAGSTIFASGSVGAIIFNIIITTYVNPRDLKPDFVEKDVAYFSQSEILVRIPMVFIILGIFTISTQLVGFVLLLSPESDSVETEGILSKATKLNSDELSRTFSSTASSSNANGRKSIVVNETTKQNNANLVFDDTKYSGTIENSRDLSPKAMLKTKTFYLLCFSLMTTSLASMVVSNYYKYFAQYWIRDDSFFTFVGNGGAISSAFFRLALGQIYDKLMMKTEFIITLTVFIIPFVFWYFTAIFSRFIYLFVTDLLIGLGSAVLLLYNLAAMRFFGHTYFPTNYGLIMLAMAATNLISAPIASELSFHFGWFWLFFTVSALMAVSLVLVIAFMDRK